MKRLLACLLAVLCLSCVRQERPDQDVFPQHNGTCVNDFADLISDSDEKIILDVCKDMADHQIAVAVVCTIDSVPRVKKEYENIMLYAGDLFEHWGIGRKDIDDGLLFLVSKSDRKVAINTGYGTEHILHDSSAGRILDTCVVPRFRNGEYGLGIIDGLRAAKAVMEKNKAFM